MHLEQEQPRSEREQTDESLRREREKVDRALEEELAAIDETADAVIARARARADDVLAAARTKTDEMSASAGPGARSRRALEKERGREDDVVRDERARADDTLRAERAEHVGILSIERGKTDTDLLSERTRADNLLATRDQFLGIVSHDLRALLNVTVTAARLIASEAPRDGQGGATFVNAQRIQRSGARMNRLIGDLVDVASIQAGILAVKAEVGDPTHVATEAVDTFHTLAAASGITLVADIMPSSARVAFDPARILQVLANLLGNAIKFTPANGTVVVSVHCVGDDIRFAVRDTGVGIPANKLEAIFERFLQIGTNDRRGVGLGLYISKCIVQAHGGRIWAESNQGAGSTFCFTLPVS